jgi:hypothetical protein
VWTAAAARRSEVRAFTAFLRREARGRVPLAGEEA